MIIKKFQANTETDAIMLAKEEMGKDAIVMNIKTISPKGIFKLFHKSLVEVTAAVDDSVSYKNDQPKVEPQVNPRKTLNPDIIYGDYDDDKASGSFEDEIIGESSAIEQKLNNLQNLLEKQLNVKETEVLNDTKENPKNKNLACIQLIYNQLVSNEVDEIYANQIMNEIDGSLTKDSSIDKILSSVYQKLVLKLGQPRIIETGKKQPRFIFFIGPTGVGKTTTIAKIASKYKMQYNAKIAFLTADTYRIAAVEQLRTYANIMGIPMEVIYTEDDLVKAQKKYADYDLIFVDTAGRSHRNKEQRDDIESLLNVISNESKETYLVLSATTKYKDLVKITETYSDITDYNLIFTKLDETGSVGNIFNIRMLTNAPLSYVTFGQDVPDDIELIDAQSIAKKLLRGQ
ncbi:MAG: flagellar biosynthesis protein FlhF [Clostridiales bacterium]|nr:flagellar biosynthesis protein FlhF [Clostridiales bacterium]